MTIVLMTDFGDSSFVGQMKGVIYQINPDSKIIDLTHSIEKFNILEAGFTLFNSLKYFQMNSVFVCVVDPGVGSSRKPIIIKSENYIFIGPDNGLFTLILDNLNVNYVVEIRNFDSICENISPTFHGRDIFAPIAAKIINGADIGSFGNVIDKNSLVKDNRFYPKVDDNLIEGNILFSDSFGNLVSNINSSQIKKDISSIEFGNIKINKISNTFSDVEIGEFVAYIGSSSYLELAINQGNLYKFLNKSTKDLLVLIK